ncbi:MAG: HEAT repeat domain-containing protein [Rhodothermales bacterium]|nr:HEAT repeat domain-containing protein [Rhodothermales bacterium]
MAILRHFAIVLALVGFGGSACRPPAPPPAVYLLTGNLHARCLSVLREGLLDGAPETAIHAAEALTGARYGFEVRPVMLDLLAVVQDGRVRASLVGELVRSGDEASIVALQDGLLEPDMDVRVASARTLFSIARAGDPALLHRAMQEGEDERLRLYAAAALQRAGRGETIGFIRQRLESDDPIVRSTAADVLLVLGDNSDIPALQASLGRAVFETDRTYAERTLAVLGDEAARRALHQQLGHPDSVTRAHAARAAAEAWLVDGASRLYALLDDPVMDVRVRAAHALLVLSDAEAPAYARRVGLSNK